jgi:hypothetical protein
MMLSDTVTKDAHPALPGVLEGRWESDQSYPSPDRASSSSRQTRPLFVGRGHIKHEVDKVPHQLLAMYQPAANCSKRRMHVLTGRLPALFSVLTVEANASRRTHHKHKARRIAWSISRYGQ